MDDAVLEWATTRLAEHPPVSSVLDIGSLNVNGSIRSIFGPDTTITGLDMRPGPDVDLVAAASRLLEPNPPTRRRYDAITCCEMLEHDPTPWLTFRAIAKYLKSGGLALITARGVSRAGGVFGRHDHPGDWWRFMEGTLPMLCEQVGLKVVDETEDSEAPGWFCAAVKP